MAKKVFTGWREHQISPNFDKKLLISLVEPFFSIRYLQNTTFFSPPKSTLHSSELYLILGICYHTQRNLGYPNIQNIPNGTPNPSHPSQTATPSAPLTLKNLKYSENDY